MKKLARLNNRFGLCRKMPDKINASPREPFRRVTVNSTAWVGFVVVTACACLAGMSHGVTFGVAESGALRHYVEDGNWAVVDQVIAKLAQSDAKCIRTGIPTSLYLDRYLHEQDPQAETMMDNLEEFYSRCNAAGVSVLLLLAYGSYYDFVDLYSATDCAQYVPPDAIRYKFPVEDHRWQLFVHAIAERYGRYVDGYEIWNEPDAIGRTDDDGDMFHGRVEDHIRLVKLAVAEIRAVDPDVPVASGGLACYSSTYRSYLEALLDPTTGIYYDCDAIGLHTYDNSAIENLRVYYEVCSQIPVDPLPVWVTECGRHLNQYEGKYFSLAGDRAYTRYALGVFLAYGVERAYRYSFFDDSGGLNLFNVDSGTVVDAADKWHWYSSNVALYKDLSADSVIGYGRNDMNEVLFGVAPYEEYIHGSVEGDDLLGSMSNPATVQTTFSFDSGDCEAPLATVTHTNVLGTFELPIGFDVSDSWVQSFSDQPITICASIECDGSAVELKYERDDGAGAHDFRQTTSDHARWDGMVCSALLDGLTVMDHAEDYLEGVDPGCIETRSIALAPGEISEIAIQLDDWVFNNGVARRADFMFVPVNNEPFKIHQIRIVQTLAVDYFDRSSETGLQYSGQPRNANTVDFDGDGIKDLLITRFPGHDVALGWIGEGYSPNGAPVFQPHSLVMFPSNTNPPAGTEGIIAGDFDNDGHEDFFAPHTTNGGRLYRNIGGQRYEDWTTSSGLDAAVFTGAMSHAHSASWVDYDGDGDLDLAVLSGDAQDHLSTLYLLHNDGGTFDHVALQGDTAFMGHSMLWADFDGDGDLDVIIPKTFPMPVGTPPADYYERYYINQGDGTFIEDAWNRLGGLLLYDEYATAVVLDIENDGDLDLYVCGAVESVVAVNDGQGTFSVYPLFLPPTETPSDLTVFDYDLDGYQDILLGYGYDGAWSPLGYSSVRLLANRSGNLVDETAAAGLTGNGKFAGFAAADYNADGFTDLYLTRQDTAAFFYKARTAAGHVKNHWLGVRLHSPYGANNTTGLGATVTVTVGSDSWIQVVDGGGTGVSSQRDRDLVFGLGTASGTATITVRWPSGRTQTVSGVSLDQRVTVTDDSPVVDEPSVQFSRVFHLDTGLTDWVFTWHVYNESPVSGDQVTFATAGVPARCLPPYQTLDEQTPGVTVATPTLQGDGTWKHVLVLAGVTCEARCNIPYEVQSGVSDFTSVSESRVLKISHCVSAQ